MQLGGAQPSLSHHTTLFTNAAGIVTPIATSVAPGQVNAPRPIWAMGGAANITGIHRGVPNLTVQKSADSSDRSTGNQKPHDEESTVATLATEADEMERREATATALLLVSAQAVKHNNTGASEEALYQEQEAPTTQAPAPADEGTVPLKKRMKHPDYIRRNSTTEETISEGEQPYHVSPVSHSSHDGTSRVVGNASSSEEHTPSRPSRAANANRSSSYDSKESPYQTSNEAATTQALPDSAKIHNTTDIALKPPAHVSVPHFPSVLHRVLSDEEFSGTVLQWLPDGEAFKVLRWDALRRNVLPLYFSELRDEDGKGSGTIDAFLWHLTAWGFEEVKDGTDVGAYRHDVSFLNAPLLYNLFFIGLLTCAYLLYPIQQLFIRGAQKLCKKMRFTAIPADDDFSSKGPKTVSPGRVGSAGPNGDRSILQVPSLMSRSEAESSSSKPNSPNKRARYDEPSVQIPKTNIRRQSSPHPPGWPSAMIVNFRPEEAAYADAGSWGQYYTDPSHHGMRHIGQYGHSPSYDPRYQYRHQGPESVSQQHYTPPRVQSTRGRFSTTNRGATSSPTSGSPVSVPQRPSFPVSNRGKGVRGRAVCRSSVPSGSLSPAATTADRTSPSGSPTSSPQTVGGSYPGVAIAISRKTKRKLPLNRKPASPIPETAACDTPAASSPTASPVVTASV